MKKIERKTGIFLLFEGLPRTVIESQIMVNAQVISATLAPEIWAFAAGDGFEKSRENLAKFSGYGVKIRLFRGIRPGLPFSTVLNSFLLLLNLLFAHKFSFIHARTEYSAACAIPARLVFRIPIIWDCRGDVFSEFIFRNKNWPRYKKILFAVKLLTANIQLFLAKTFSAHSIFVSEALRQKLAPSLSSENSSVIPCTASSELFYFSNQLRDRTRNELSFNSHDKVAIYCGSASSWQCIDDAVKIIKFNLQRQDFKAIFLSPDIWEIKKRFSDQEQSRIIFRSVQLNEVNAYLNAADIGLFIRQSHPLNRVASPVKFAEYCLAGLPIVMTKEVEQSFNFAKDFGNIILYNFETEFYIPEPYSCEKRCEISKNASARLSRNAYDKIYKKIYTNICNGNCNLRKVKKEL